MNRAKIDGRDYLVPGALNELGAPQLSRIAELIHSGKSAQDIRYGCLLALLSVKRHLGLIWLFFGKLRLDELELILLELMPLTHFLFEKESNLTRQLLPKIRIPWSLTWLHGPTELLGNVSFLEYMKAEAAFLKYHRTKDEHHLNRLVAILYRPKSRRKATADEAQPDNREKFNEALVEKREQLVSRLPLGTRLAVLLFFVGSRHQMTKMYKEVFPEPEPGEKPKKGGLGWPGVLKTLAGDLKSYEPTAEQNIHTVLFHMKANILEAREREAEQQKNRK